MYIQIGALILIFVLSLVLVIRNFKYALSVLLVLSVLLHKELFSIYRWDLLPVRVFMLALFFAGMVKFVSFAFSGYKKLFSYLKDPFVFTLILLWLVRGLSIFYTKNLVDSIQLFGFFTTVVVLGLFLYFQFKKSPEDLFKYIRTYIYVSFGLCLFGYLQILLAEKFNFIVGSFWPIPGNIPRIGSLFWDVNHFGALLSSVIPLLGVIVLTDKKWVDRIIHGFMLISMSGILLLTNSRTAWIIGAVALLSFVLILAVKRFGIKALGAITLAICLVSLPVLIEYSNKASPFRAKIRNYFNYRIDSFDSHFLLLTGTVQIFEKYPILGGGYGGFFEHFKYTQIAPVYFSRDPAGLTQKVPAHTIWGEVIAETGIVGLMSYVLFIGLIVFTLLYAALSTKDTKVTLYSTAMVSVVFGLMLGGIFYSYNSEFFWLVLFMYFVYGVGASGLGAASFTKILTYFRNYRYLLLFIVGSIAAFLIFFNLGTNHLIPWDEAIYSKIAKNMVTTGEYMTEFWRPNKIWFEKPPLYMWIEAFAFNLMGFTEFAARLPSALLGLGTVVVVFLLGRKMFNKTVAFVAAFSLITTFNYLYYARTSMLDVSVTFFITLALYLYICAHNLALGSKKRLLLWILTGVSTGLAVMTKGVVGFIPFVVIALYELYLYVSKAQKFSGKNFVEYLIFVFFALVILLPWHVYMYIQQGPDFIQNYIVYHVIDRATSSIEDKGRPVFWYLEVMKVSMRLWFIALLGAFPFALWAGLFKKTKAYANLIFVLVWSLFVFALFSSSVSKLVWYIIPIYPAVCILIGFFIDAALQFVITRLPKLNNIVFKSLLLYLMVFGVLFYLFMNKELVYTSDLTGAKASMLALKASTYDSSQTIYVDSIEYPLSLYYAGEPITEVDFRGLKQTISSADYAQKIVFVTKQSRFEQIAVEFPGTIMVGQQKEWVLGVTVTQYENDKAQLAILKGQLSEVNARIIMKKSQGLRPDTADMTLAQNLQDQYQTINMRLSNSLSPVKK